MPTPRTVTEPLIVLCDSFKFNLLDTRFIDKLLGCIKRSDNKHTFKIRNQEKA